MKGSTPLPYGLTLRNADVFIEVIRDPHSSSLVSFFPRHGAKLWALGFREFLSTCGNMNLFCFGLELKGFDGIPLPQ